MQKKTFLFGSLLIIAGLICLSIPLFHEIQQLVKVNQLEAAMSQISYENHEEANDEEIDFEGSPLSEIYTVEVPSVRVKEYVKAETTEENLKIAATQIKPIKNLAKEISPLPVIVVIEVIACLARFLMWKLANPSISMMNQKRMYMKSVKLRKFHLSR